MKNLFKKIGALLVAAVMVLSMCTAVFAENGATITLKNFDKANKVEYMQIIQKDETKTSGWQRKRKAGVHFYAHQLRTNAYRFQGIQGFAL